MLHCLDSKETSRTKIEVWMLSVWVYRMDKIVRYLKGRLQKIGNQLIEQQVLTTHLPHP